MKLFLSLRTKIPLITLMTVVFLPTNIAEAASYPSTNKAFVKQENIKNEDRTESYHQNSEILHLFFTQKAQQIELVIFFSTILLSIVVPELFYKSQKNNQS